MELHLPEMASWEQREQALGGTLLNTAGCARVSL